MATIRETIEKEVSEFCRYFDWEANSEQAESLRTSLIQIATQSADMSKDFTILKILNMKKTAYVEREPMLEPLQLVDANMQQARSHTRLLQYVSVEDIKKLK